jgi:acyl-CoA reductase-like NAD-dependent aldehyde dehydrogenase
VSSRALLDDAFASLTLKRKLEQGKVLAGNYPPSIVGRVARADKDVIDLALAAAADAAPVWAALPLTTRLHELGGRLREALISNAGQVVDALVEEGHPAALAGWQVSGMLEFYGAESLAFYERQMYQERAHGGRRIVVRRQPDGVVCLSPPHNASLSSALLGVAAMMAGNTLVVRAPRSSPLGVMRVMRDLVAPILDEIGAPAGSLNLVCGDPAPMLTAWLDSPLVDDIMYFGSSENGLKFEGRCVAAGKKPILELAGNDIVVVWRDADLQLAAEALAESFYGSGQLCMVPNLVLVHPEVADPLIQHLIRAAERVRPGYPADDDTLLTPVLRNEKFFSCLKDAIDKGAELICGGYAMQIDGSPDPGGIFLAPTVIRVNGLAQSRLVDAVRHETFFPLLPVVVADSRDDHVLLEEFISFVNSNEYGLRNSVWARDEYIAGQFFSRITNAGLLKINDSHIGFLPFLPTHGGTGMTGGVYGEANYPFLRASHVQGVSWSSGTRPREAAFGVWEALRSGAADLIPRQPGPFLRTVRNHEIS